ncbi:hypothetical protein Pla22_13440 [Rubripirellula amarantea]|uniref:CREG-like beta-barrel domain-containing protein n=2 Tax=Rubripirellula amarantea TaxID=2527999 RepID=A0A5C5WV59_9BACT|nr:hypothetical protein Pla22_13440 [Rubripirellula amarantea]
MDSALAASLGTIADGGAPFVSLVTVARIKPDQMAMLLSGLAVHTKNLANDHRVSLLLVSPGGENGDPLAGARATLIGSVQKLARGADHVARTAFLQRHPEAAMYADFGDFAFYEMMVHKAHLVAGFGKIVTVSGDQLNEVT